MLFYKSNCFTGEIQFFKVNQSVHIAQFMLIIAQFMFIIAQFMFIIAQFMFIIAQFMFIIAHIQNHNLSLTFIFIFHSCTDPTVQDIQLTVSC